MGWDGIFKKIFVPWDGTKNFEHRPIPSHGTEFSEKRPMGWDGMGLSHPTRSPGMQYYKQMHC